MSAERPTFSESWYRLSDLSPRLLGAVKVHRQHFRGRRWYVLQDPASNRFFRLDDAAYHFAAMLDGRRTVSQVWRECMERYGDAAPTQGEVINLLGRLHASNLLQGDFAPDAAALFRRYRKRVWREVRGALTHLLCIRVPLWDPDRFLERWISVLGGLFSGYGLALWAAIVAAGLWTLGGHMQDLKRQASGVLNPANLPLLYVALVVVKIFHELGHALACKAFGRRTGAGGEVHKMGLAFLVFTPLPFVDASSAWAFRHKLHRVVVGASGMLVELAIAALAALLWTHTAEGTTIHAVAYNVIFIAGVSSLVFNANPLLRYDGYYILVDLLEIPNLESRSRSYCCYLVKRYLWGVTNADDPSHSPGERGWLALYAIASTICRVIVFALIIVFLGDKFFSLGVALAVIMLTGWVLPPLGRLMRYLAVSQELDRLRARAVWSFVMIALGLFIALGRIEVPDRCRIEGVVEPFDYAVIHMQTAGFVRRFLESGARTGPDGPLLVEAGSPGLAAQHDELLAELRRLQINRQMAQTREAAKVQIMDEKVAALREQIARTEQDLEKLALKAPISGIWVAPDIDQIRNRYVPRGQRIGVVANLDRLCIRAVAGQMVAARLVNEAHPMVAIRAKNQPGIELTGRLQTIIPAGQKRLPSAALGYAAGGATQIDSQDTSGRRTVEPFFEIRVIPSPRAAGRVRPGQTMVLRFETSPKPLLAQGWRKVLQLFQRRFQV